MKRKIDLESLPLKDWKKEATMFQDDYTAGAGTSWLLNVAKAENKMIWEMISAIEESPAAGSAKATKKQETTKTKREKKKNTGIVSFTVYRKI